VAYPLLAALFVVNGGKPYYLGGLYPVLLAAGADPVVAWVARGSRRLRTSVLVAALVISLAVSAFLFLPVVPVARLADTPVVAINYDAGETVGWPRFADTVRGVRDRLPAGARVAVLTSNYGEAGAIDRYAPELGPAYSGHNSYAEWGPPPNDVTTVVAIGFRPEQLRAWFGEVQLAARIDDGVGLDNDEQDQPVYIARGPLRPWPALWPQLRRFG
jgi:hypothetical protein